MKFTATGRKRDGKTSDFEVEADDRQTALELLREQNPLFKFNEDGLKLAETKPVKIPGKFPRFTFHRVAKAMGLSDSEADAAFMAGIAAGIVKPAGMTGQLNDIQMYEQ